MDVTQIAETLQRFTGTSLTDTLSRIESELKGLTARECAARLAAAGAQRETLLAAAHLKRLAGQINVSIHALGILLCLLTSWRPTRPCNTLPSARETPAGNLT